MQNPTDSYLHAYVSFTVDSMEPLELGSKDYREAVAGAARWDQLHCLAKSMAVINAAEYAKHHGYTHQGLHSLLLRAYQVVELCLPGGHLDLALRRGGSSLVYKGDVGGTGNDASLESRWNKRWLLRMHEDAKEARKTFRQFELDLLYLSQVSFTQQQHILSWVGAHAFKHPAFASVHPTLQRVSASDQTAHAATCWPAR